LKLEISNTSVNVLTDSVGHVIIQFVPRHDPKKRLLQLVKRATEVFIERGYKDTQMDDIATSLGVAKGTVYVYVESKEALFDLVARCADTIPSFDPLPRLPIPTPKRGATLKYIRDRLAENQNLPALAKALDRSRPGPVREELEEIVQGLYDTVERNRQGLKLLDASAKDLPELAALWFEGARGALVTALTEYLDREIHKGTMKCVADVSVAARLIVETVVFWAAHRQWDPHPQKFDGLAARETVIGMLTDALVKD
jgi:AcrR family transcriptional regulator